MFGSIIRRALGDWRVLRVTDDGNLAVAGYDSSSDSMVVTPTQTIANVYDGNLSWTSGVTNIPNGSAEQFFPNPGGFAMGPYDHITLFIEWDDNAEVVFYAWNGDEAQAGDRIDVTISGMDLNTDSSVVSPFNTPGSYMIDFDGINVDRFMVGVINDSTGDTNVDIRPKYRKR